MKCLHEHEYKTTKVYIDFGDRMNLQKIIIFRIPKKFGKAIDGAH